MASQQMDGESRSNLALRLFSIARCRGEISRWLALSPSHQSAPTAFASCSCIVSASVKAIGAAIILGSYRLIASRPMKS